MDFIQQNIFLVAVAAALIAAIISVEFSRATRKYRDITPAEMVQLINKEQALVLDLRESDELASGTIRGAWHIAGSALLRQKSELEKHKDKPMVAFCASGVRAPKLCRELTKYGFDKIYHLKGGLAAWQQAGMPVVAK